MHATLEAPQDDCTAPQAGCSTTTPQAEDLLHTLGTTACKTLNGADTTCLAQLLPTHTPSAAFDTLVKPSNRQATTNNLTFISVLLKKQNP